MIKNFTPRRVVTGHDQDGYSVITSDSVGPERNKTNPGMYDFWQELEGRVVESTSAADNVAGKQVLAPPDGGHKFRFFCIPPAPKALGEMTEEEKEKFWTGTKQMFGSFGASHEWTGIHVPGMHKTETIDYIIVLQGEVTLVLDKDDVYLKPFDVVVQRGTNHGWYVAPGADPCMMVAVLIDSKVQGGKSVEEYVKSKGGKLVGGSVPSKL